jgi:formylglycine-generating enzyme required for sulfatase activity
MFYGDIMASGVDYPPTTFPKNGQRTPFFVDLYAVSKKGTPPSTNMTWFQAQQACRASGKRLPTDEEWLAAASGTPDPGDGTGLGGTCLNNAMPPPFVRPTGQGTQCRSAWGAEDMIGNLSEWTSGWYASVGGATALVNQGTSNWPPDYNGDGTWNIAGVAQTSAPFQGLPAAASRGGMLQYGALAGVFALDLNQSPANYDLHLGFRCVVPR